MKLNLLKMKTEIKRLGALIKENRPKFKQAQRSGDNAAWSLGAEVGRASYTVRHMGLAYGLLRGRSMDVMEKPREDNKPNEDVIRKYMEEYAHEPEQVIRSSAV